MRLPVPNEGGPCSVPSLVRGVHAQHAAWWLVYAIEDFLGTLRVDFGDLKRCIQELVRKPALLGAFRLCY